MNNFSQALIIAVTPTYARPVQKAELTRLCHTFLLVPNIHWIVVEDSKVKTKLVSKFLASCGVPYTHLNAPTPPDLKLRPNDPSWYKPRGVVQRNEAIFHIRDNFNHLPQGPGAVIYFADDDNTYSLELFEAMRSTNKVSVWPVALVGGLMVEGPIFNREGTKVTGWNAVWKPNRKFAIDMAGFAVNLHHLLTHPKAKFSNMSKRGLIESDFLSFLINLEELEPKGIDGEILVWHTRTEKVKLDMERKLTERNMASSNQHFEV